MKTANYLAGCCILTIVTSFSLNFLTLQGALATIGQEPGLINEIPEIFIEGRGNNKYEARIRAHELGMSRVLLLVADQLGISEANLQSVPYLELEQIFKLAATHNETVSNEAYSATATYQYDLGKLYKILLKYGTNAVEDMFIEYLVLPIFKQHQQLNIWSLDERWNSVWQKQRGELLDYKILCPKLSDNANQLINAENVFALTYSDFTKIFAGQLIKNIMLITAEFFTDRQTGESLMRVERYILSPNYPEPKIIREDYPLRSSNDIKSTALLVIDKIISDYGMLRKHGLDEDENEEKGAGEKRLESEGGEQAAALRTIIMNFDVYNQQELDLVVKKLKRVSQIDKFTVKHDYNTHYKIIIETNTEESDLAKGLYLEGLSYRIHGKLYNLIDVKKGG